MKKISAKKLFIIWWIVFLLVGFCCSIYSFSFAFLHGHPPTDALGAYHIIITLVVLFFLFPLLFATYRKAKKEQEKGILAATSIILLVMLLWLGLNVIDTVRAIIT
jgi:Mn2+/Fe2+ NRAMP family transporter